MLEFVWVIKLSITITKKYKKSIGTGFKCKRYEKS